MASLRLLLLPMYEKSYSPSPEREDNDQDDDLVKPDHGPAGGDGEGAVGWDGGDWKNIYLTTLSNLFCAYLVCQAVLASTVFHIYSFCTAAAFHPW